MKRDGVAWLALLLPLLGAAEAEAGTRVVAGGGSEGDLGDTTAWSYRLYGALLDDGDVNGDGEVVVAILSASVESDWLPEYFVWLGADRAFNVWVPSRNAADDAGQMDVVRTADVVFLKGGDQGVYYDDWNETRLEENLRYVVETRGGAIGGTSAGAMSQSEYSFAGGQDLISLDVLEDAQTPYLDDTDGGSGIHDDFLGFIPGVVIDTHYTARARLGRLLGILAKTTDDARDEGILAIGIEERTGLIVRGDEAEVVGVGSVDFLRRTETTLQRRAKRKPLVMTDVALDRLTEGWWYDLGAQEVDLSRPPAGASRVVYGGDGPSNSGNLTIYGDDPAEARNFERTVTVAPLAYSNLQSGIAPYVYHSIGILDAQDSDRRGSMQESLFRALYDHSGYTGFLVTDSARITRSSSDPDLLEFRWNAQTTYRRAAAIVVDGKGVTWKGLSPHLSGLDTGSGTLKAAALVGLKVHVMADTANGWPGYDSRTHEVVD